MSTASATKSKNWNSMTGRKPVSAAPTPQPVNAASEIGVSRTRAPPKRSCSPAVAWKTPPAGPISSPSNITVPSRSISCRSASLIACTKLSLRVPASGNVSLPGTGAAVTAANAICIVGSGLSRPKATCTVTRILSNAAWEQMRRRSSWTAVNFSGSRASHDSTSSLGRGSGRFARMECWYHR